MTLDISATGVGALYYKWIKDENPITIQRNLNINGVNTPSLYIRHFLKKHTGSYKCIVSNRYGSVESKSANLERFEVLSHPQHKLALCGQSITFTVEVVGPSGLTYQWKKDDKDINDIQESYTGSNTAELKINSVMTQHKGKYKCIIKKVDDFLESKTAELRKLIWYLS